MKQDYFEAYKKAIKQHFEKEKNGIYSSFLLQPSRANLRKLCEARLNENANLEDLNTFKIFMRFDFKPENNNKLKNETDRFRSIENFLKGSTECNDLETINLVAILVDFSPRPFLKFVKSINGEETNAREILSENEGTKTLQTTRLEFDKKSSMKKKMIMGLLGFTALFSIGYTVKDLAIPQKECMQWQHDQYVAIDCQGVINNLYTAVAVVPFDENTAKLRRVTVCDTTTFFEGDKPIIWYCKVNGVPEFFNGPGLHPITGKGIRPITKYIINKYVIQETN